jgi:hypothetical protein
VRKNSKILLNTPRWVRFLGAFKCGTESNACECKTTGSTGAFQTRIESEEHVPVCPPVSYSAPFRNPDKTHAVMKRWAKFNPDLTIRRLLALGAFAGTMFAAFNLNWLCVPLGWLALLCVSRGKHLAALVSLAAKIRRNE